MNPNTSSGSESSLITRLAHLCLKTDQLPVMVAFYRDTLGFPIKFGHMNNDGVYFGYYFDLGNRTFIEIFDHQMSAKHWNLCSDPLQRPPATPYSHFCLETSDLDQLKSFWESKGVVTSAIRIGMDGSRQMWINDPDGNSFEVMEYTPQSLQIIGRPIE